MADEKSTTPNFGFVGNDSTMIWPRVVITYGNQGEYVINLCSWKEPNVGKEDFILRPSGFGKRFDVWV